MSMEATSNKVQGTTTAATQKKSLGPIAWWVREVASLLVWMFVGVKLFVYDVDLLLIAYYAPSLEPFVPFRFFILIGSVALLWLVLGNQRFGTLVGYILGYPLVVLFWKLPQQLFRNWAIVIAFLPAVYSLGLTFRMSFITTTFALLCFLAIAISAPPFVVVPSMFVLLVYLAHHYIRRFRMAFRPSSTFTDIAGLVRKLRDYLHKQYLSKDLSGLDPASPEYMAKISGELSQVYMFTQGLRFVAERLREVAASKKLDLYLVTALAFTVFLTVVIFGFEYSAVEQLVPGSFQSRGTLSLLAMIGYSFGTLMTADIAGIVPVTTLAITLSYLELFAALVLLVILVFVILTIGRERYREDMDQVIAELDGSALTIQNALETHFGMSFTEAEIALLAVNAALVNGIRQIRGLEALEPPSAQGAKPSDA